MVAMATSSSLVNDMVLLWKKVSKGWGEEEVGGGTWGGEKRDAVRPKCDKAEDWANTRQEECALGTVL